MWEKSEPLPNIIYIINFRWITNLNLSAKLLIYIADKRLVSQLYEKSLQKIKEQIIQLKSK